MLLPEKFTLSLSNEALGQTILYLITAQVILLAAADLARPTLQGKR